MFTFETDQDGYDVAGTKLGGQAGEHPTATVGGIFYKGDPLLEDPKTGEFSESAGCSPHNEVIRWQMGNPITDHSKLLRRAVANGAIGFVGADFNLYGPLHAAEGMDEVVSMADAYVGYGAQMGENRRPPLDHPLFNIFRKG